MARGAGKFKTKRGGGRNFSRAMGIDRDASSFPGGRDPRKKNADGDDDDDDDSEEDSEEDEDEDEDDEEEESGKEEEGKPELTREQRRELKKKQVQAKQAAKDGEEDEEDEDLINPNHVQKKLTISDLNEPRQLTRREREQKEKKEADERYWKLHVQGKTDQAKSDLGRLAKIRAEREAAAAKRQAEAEAKAKEIQAKKETQLNRKR
ncbi:hypothetical protein AGABI1DRAFT_116422 [Agaricus bisporus var. burnettii JB137-S8]|uniref:Casein kinase substrate phosphoprotein PP28 domain-containing protein n=1 Tax=Agaricus bisporus var. burnettii (strain JB137-S8 / ATCC MYA-4627 / FGSC 10392) TaxID=597362 RepID=K5WX71_AGABU|nr:uncharacterized protein AGABI1DRAFT_116422 [Agaricus bisporus var. burnettii JB137-S8]EKM75418.1 hypothetical protein AGABI1DRAFT_116422 [Agaricus bisporus var. burnettii JB137-S8]